MQSSKILNSFRTCIFHYSVERSGSVAVAHKGIKTRTTDVLFTCPIFLSTGEIKSMPASSKEKIVNEKWKIHTELGLRKYQRYLVGIVCSLAGNNYLFCHYKSIKGKASDSIATKLTHFP